MMKLYKSNYFSKILTSFIFKFLFMTNNIYAAAEEVVAPNGFINQILVLLPLVVILILLYKNIDMTIAGYIGGALAIIISYVFLSKPITLAKANETLMKAIPDMLNFAGPIINSALAMAVFKAGGYTSALTLAKKAVRNRVELLAVFVVLLQGAATYMSGIGGGSAMVIAPLAFAVVGVIPEVIAAMSIITAISFTTSPSSLETSIVAKLSNSDPTHYSQSVIFITAIAAILSLALAYYGTKKNKSIESSKTETEFDKMSNKDLWKMTIPTIYLLFSVIFGPIVNKALSMPLFTPVINIIIVLVLITICTKLNINDASNSMLEGSNYILTRLFGVGIFITFIRIISDTGAFVVIVNAAKILPASIILPSLILAGFLIGVVSGAYVGAILTLVLPIAVTFGLTTVQLGFIAMGVGLGSQMCFVNITMQALSTGFKLPILSVVKGNTKWILSSVVLLMIGSMFI